MHGSRGDCDRNFHETKYRFSMTCYQMKQSFLQNDNAFISVLLISQHKTLIKLGSKNVTK